MIALAELIERFEPALLQRYGPRLLPSQQQALVPATYFLVTFTLPSELRRLA